MRKSLSICFLAAMGLAAPAAASTFSSFTKIDAFCSVSDLCKNKHYEISPAFDITMAVPMAATSDGILQFTAWGDFNRAEGEVEGVSSEHLIIEAEGFSFGNFLNSDPTDDIFADDGFAGGTRHDVGNEFGRPTIKYPKPPTLPEHYGIIQPPRTGTAIIPFDVLSSIISDGLFTLTVRTFGGVTDGPLKKGVQIEEFFEVALFFDTGPRDDLTFETASLISARAAVVVTPLPASALTLLTAVAGMLLWGRRRARAASSS